MYRHGALTWAQSECRWHDALPRLDRLRVTVSLDLKLMTLLLGRYAAGTATVPAFLWMLLAPKPAPRRFAMFRTALLYHHVLHSGEFRVRYRPI